MSRSSKKPLITIISLNNRQIICTPEVARSIYNHSTLESVLQYKNIEHICDKKRAADLILSTKSEIAGFKKCIMPLAKIAKAKADAQEKAHQARWKREEAQRMAAEKKRLEAIAKKYPLPESIKVADLLEISWSKRATDAQLSQYTARFSSSEFEMWYTESFGWCSPTLSINNRNRCGSYRTYAVRLKDNALVRIGNGPHVLAKVTVRLSKSNAKRILTRYIDTLAQGAEKAHETRDRISTRRANTALRRRSFSLSF